MADKKIILVTGATGKQGGAVARNLFGSEFDVRALTRDPEKTEARELRDKGADIFEGTFDDAASLEKAMDGVYGVFSVQNFWEVGYDREVEQGIRVADAAVKAGVEHFVYSSVGSADQDTGIPHFDSKYEIEQHLHTLELPVTIIRPVFFMNNWEADMMKNMVLGGTLAQPLSPDTRLQQIDVDDVGVFAALAFQAPDEWIGRELDIAGDDPTMVEVADAFSEALGTRVSYQQVPWDDFRAQAGDEYADMYRWFEDVGYQADIEALRREHPGLTNFEQYLRWHEWGGEEERIG